MAMISLTECTCSIGPMICATCGGLLGSVDRTTSMLSNIEDENSEWLAELDRQDRLNSTLATFRVIDKQINANASFGTTVSQAIKEIGSGISEMKKEVIQDLIERFGQMQDQNHSETAQLRETVREIVLQQAQDVMNQVKFLQEQGKSLVEIQGLLKDTVGSVQTVMTTLQIPTVKGEEGEIQTIQGLKSAFFGIEGIDIEPIGGSDAADGIVKFFHSGLEVGRLLLEIKARRTWSNDFLDQMRNDMKRYNTSLAVLIADKLPRNAKGKGFSIDTETGLVVAVGSELAFPTVSMFYELHRTVFRLQKKALDIRHLSSNHDLIFYVNDNLKSLDDCKKILDAMNDAVRKVKEHVTTISSRLQENNGKIAQILSGLSESTRTEIDCQGMSETRERLE